MKKVAIIGAGGHTRTVIQLLKLNRIEIEGIYDENLKNQNETILGYSVKELSSLPNDIKVIISKGDIEDKLNLTKQFSHRILTENLIHNKAVIETSDLGEANQISSNTYLAPTSKVGDNNIIYSGSVMEHESSMGNSCTVTINVSICGRVTIGNNCYLGAGSVILPNLKVTDNVTIGAGCVVTKNITKPGTYVGIPAKKIK